jgi:bacterioferritin-associated ferredoxin
MILCLCKGVSERNIKEMAQSGKTLKEIVETCEASTCCGACAVDLKNIVRKETQDRKMPSARNNACSSR